MIADRLFNKRLMAAEVPIPCPQSQELNKAMVITMTMVLVTNDLAALAFTRAGAMS